MKFSIKNINEAFSHKDKDRADSNIVSMVLLIPLIFAFLITMIDSSLYLSNRAQMSNFARDGARTVAIMGGNGTSTKGTPIEKAYGMPRSEACEGLANVGMPLNVGFNGASHDSTVTECEIMKAISSSKGLVAVNVKSVTCNPEIAISIGQHMQCTIQWSYNSIPGSSFSFIKKAPDNEPPSWGSSNGLIEMNTTTGSSESEVDLSNVKLVPRP